MKDIKDHVIRENTARLLRDAGIKQESIYYHKPYYDALDKTVRRCAIVARKPPQRSEVLTPEERAMQPSSAFLSSEIGELLPMQIMHSDPEHKIHQFYIEKSMVGWSAGYICLGCKGSLFMIVGSNLQEAMAHCLLEVIRRKLLIISQV